MYSNIFEALSFKRREAKSRETGITVIIDHGIGVKKEKDLLQTAADYIDVAKIMVGIPALLSDDVLKEKIKLYKKNNIYVFPGGQFLEYAIRNGETQDYFKAVKKAGFNMIEVSDNILDISFKEKAHIIKTACKDYKLKVLGETGSKEIASDTNKLIEDIHNCLDSGAWKVMFEAAELFVEGKFNEGLIGKISKEVDLSKLIFELPGGWISGITISDIYHLQLWLIEKLGRKVNIGNVDPDELLCLESERSNLGTHMDLS